MLDFLHLSTPAPPWGWSRESIISQLTVKAAFSSTGFLAHEKSCLNSTRVMQSAHGNGIFQPKSQGDHTVLIILKETNAGDKRTHSLPPCKQPETMNPKLVASGPHREIYPLCPSSSAPLASMSTEERCLMIPILKVEFVLNYGSLLPSHFRPHRASMFTFFLKGPAIPSSEFSFQTF